jgi:hypothetical protein
VAIRYPLSRWHALARYIEDGHIEIDNNAANALCPADRFRKAKRLDFEAYLRQC